MRWVASPCPPRSNGSTPMPLQRHRCDPPSLRLSGFRPAPDPDDPCSSLKLDPDRDPTSLSDPSEAHVAPSHRSPP
eukprot:scaffold285_cov330-Pavlova_lutheri.AAC.93